MKNRKFLSFLLCLALTVSLVLPGIPVQAAEGDNGMVIDKIATKNKDGSYTIQLEAYATGTVITDEKVEETPTDIILVLDQSGSMAWDMGATESDAFYSYGATTNRTNYSNRHNNGNKNLYYKLEDGSYVQVSVKRDPATTYTEVSSYQNRGLYYSRNLYALVNGTYQSVSVDADWNYDDWYYDFTYNCNGSVIGTGKGSYGNASITGTDDGKIYVRNTNDYTYTYTYTLDGKTTTIGTSDGQDNPCDIKFYKFVPAGTTISRRNALVNALGSFVDSVSTKAAGKDGQFGTDDDVNHRIAMVGFGSKGENTELLSISGSYSGNVGVGYNNISTQNYKDVLQNMNESAGQAMVGNAINALAASGATRADLGMKMAKEILDNNPLGSNEKRNRVVIMFTDGSPTDGSEYNSTVADDAINYANQIKNGTNSATVYTVGVFSGANASNPGELPANNDSGSNRENRFMHLVSSNYPDAKNMSTPGDINPNLKGKSYYLSAGDAASLNKIFEQISQQIQTGSSSTTLGAQTVIKDIIAPQFKLPDGATEEDITLETWAYAGDKADGTKQWTQNPTAMDAKATVDGDNVDVTGFDFATNYVVKTTNDGVTKYQGHKLVIKFNVNVKDGFLGGNGVYTNTSAGVYENADAETPVLTFPHPDVDIAIKDVTVTAPDKNVYLLGNLTADQIKSGVKADCGGVEIDLSPNATNYGLDTWQNEYVDITPTFTDAAGKTVTDLSDLKDDTTYKASVTVSPKDSDGTATAKTSPEATGNINVFKPVLTFKDGTVDYKSSITATSYVDNKASKNYATENYVSTAWMHGTTAADESKMGKAPDTGLTYAYDEGVTNGIVTATDQVPIQVTVMLGTENVTQYCGFKHQACSVAGCTLTAETTDGNPAFLLHVINVSADLTIVKSGVADADKDQTFIFTVKGTDAGNTFEQKIVINGNGRKTIKDLPVGSYQITEDEGWSWRYTVASRDGTNENGNFEMEGTDKTITFKNKKDNDKWIDGSASAHNVFDNDKK